MQKTAKTYRRPNRAAAEQSSDNGTLKIEQRRKREELGKYSEEYGAVRRTSRGFEKGTGEVRKVRNEEAPAEAGEKY